ncbi:MAG: osmoprotectant transporter permease [Phaeodactylibacter sp.]|nr:osmoprotectant transporter permease [Phaeodactylibacter sp.]MCB9276673.1 osmoprotectant transporter permease [Lewinellaceae bacterium]
MAFFWALWSFDACITMVVLYFFFIGLADGSVSSFNMGIWLLLLGALAAIMLGSLWLKGLEKLLLAKLLLAVLAVPGLLYLLFMLMIIITKPRWN